MVMKTPGVGVCGALLGQAPGRSIGDAAAVALTEVVGGVAVGGGQVGVLRTVEDVPVLPVAATVVVIDVAWSCEQRHGEPVNTGRPVTQSWRKPFAPTCPPI
jgi:hypothetical protein